MAIRMPADAICGGLLCVYGRGDKRETKKKERFHWVHLDCEGSLFIAQLVFLIIYLRCLFCRKKMKTITVDVSMLSALDMDKLIHDFDVMQANILLRARRNNEQAEYSDLLGPGDYKNRVKFLTALIDEFYGAM